MSEDNKSNKKAVSPNSPMAKRVQQLKKELEDNRIAVDVFYDPETKKYKRVKIRYNLNTNKTKVMDVKENFADYQALAVHKIKGYFIRKLHGLPPDDEL